MQKSAYQLDSAEYPGTLHLSDIGLHAKQYTSKGVGVDELHLICAYVMNGAPSLPYVFHYTLQY